MAAADEGSPLDTCLLGATTALGTVAAIAYVGFLVFEALLFGVAAGALAGAGTYLHLPYVVAREGDSPPSGDSWHDVHRGAAGLALEAGGVGALALAFAQGPGVVALAGGLAVALVGYLALSAVLPEDPGT